MKQWFLILLTLVLALSAVGGAQAQTPTPNPADQFLCENARDRTGGAITVTGGFNNVFDPARNLVGNVYCRILVQDSQVRTLMAEVGNREAIQRGIIQAVDLAGLLPAGQSWNAFRLPVRVCLRGEGDIQFLNANDMSRTIRTVTPVADDGVEGSVCADIPGAGTVVLTPKGPALGGGTSSVSATFSTAAADPNAAVPLDNCQVVTTANGVFIRRAPSTDARIRWQLEDNQVMNATGIAGNWYRIDFRGSPGWIAAAFVSPMGNCLAPGGVPAGQNDLWAPGDPDTYTGLTDCRITTNFNGVHLRREPNLRGRIRWTFEDSQTLDAVGVSGNWYLIAFRGSPGWIHAEYVNEEGSCGAPGQ